MNEQAKAHGHFIIEALDKDGNLKWKEEFDNLITNEGLNKMLDDCFNSSAYTSAWYVGLKGTGTEAAGDTLASHAGWSEITDYSEGARQSYQSAAASSQAVTNSANKAAFSINGTCTVAGAFICSASTGTSGTLLCVGDFAASRSLISGDTLNVTYQASLASA